MKKKDRKREGAHDWSGMCMLTAEEPHRRESSFSVSVFRWLKTKDGKRLKKSKALFRLKGSTSHPGLVYEAAEEWCDRLDQDPSDVPGVKSLRLVSHNDLHELHWCGACEGFRVHCVRTLEDGSLTRQCDACGRRWHPDDDLLEEDTL